MAKVLKGGAYGPDGDYVGPGQPPSPDWPDWFLADLEEHEQLVDASEVQRPSADEDSEPVVVEGRSSRGRTGR
jgi:hypothetical protein